MRRLLRDPLVHFALIGLALFAGFGLLGGGGAGDVVHVNAADVAAMRASWASAWGRSPSEAELEGLIEGHIRQEVLVREARALGLDRGDTIVRRRLAQKMEFLATDSAAFGAPTEAALTEFLEEHRERFQLPAVLSFQQIYFGRDHHGDEVLEAAASARAVLRSNENANPLDLGDRFLLPLDQTGLRDDRVEQVFGAEFATQLQQLPLGTWEGPIPSGYGHHLVKLIDHHPRRDPTLEEVRAQVTQDWKEAQQKKATQAFYNKLRAKYEVTKDLSPQSEPSGDSATHAPTQPPES